MREGLIHVVTQLHFAARHDRIIVRHQVSAKVTERRLKTGILSLARMIIRGVPPSRKLYGSSNSENISEGARTCEASESSLIKIPEPDSLDA